MIVRPKWDYCMKELFRNFIILKYFISDILDIPIEKIRSLKLRNTNLWRRYKYQKQGIVDVLLELNDDTKINIELQIRTVKHWDKRQLFYMGKLLTEELSAGEDYKHMKRCITISILDFHLTWDNNYHKKYLLREENGADRATSRRVDSTVQCRDGGGSGNVGNNDEESWNFGSGERGKAYESWKMGESQIR